jgi:hypothetical protein
MNGLRGGAAVPAGGVPAERLKAYLELHTPRIAAEHNQTQHPEVINGLSTESRPDFGSFKPFEKVNIKIRFKEGRTSKVVLEGPDLNEIGQADASTTPWSLRLERGWHALRDLNTGEQKQIRVEFLEEVSDVDF